MFYKIVKIRNVVCMDRMNTPGKHQTSRRLQLGRVNPIIGTPAGPLTPGASSSPLLKMLQSQQLQQIGRLDARCGRYGVSIGTALLAPVRIHQKIVVGILFHLPNNPVHDRYSFYGIVSRRGLRR